MQTLIFSDVSPLGYGKNLGAYKIASQLRSNGYSSQVVDFFSHFLLDELKHIVDKFVTSETIWVGISTTFISQKEDFVFNSEKIKTAIKDNDVNMLSKIHDPSMSGGVYPHDPSTMKDFLKYIKEKNPNTKIIVGGAKTWSAESYEETMNRVIPDYYVNGYADEAIISLTNWLSNPEKFPEPIFHGPKKNKIESFIDYDFNDFNTSMLKFESNDHVDQGETLPIEIARGCIFKCKFCNFPLIGKKRGDYTKNKETLLKEFNYNYEHYGTISYMFMDETTNDSIEKAEFLLDVTSSLSFKISWVGYGRLDLYYANPSMAKIMKDTGLVGQQFGIETFNKKSGESIGKGLHPEKVKETLAHLKNVWGEDVTIGTGLIVGLPHDTEDYVQELEEYLMSKNCLLDSVSIYPLYLIQNMNSLFGQNPSKWGYKFDTTRGINFWYNDHMNFSRANELAVNLRLKLIENKCVQPFGQMRLKNLNIENLPWKIKQIDYLLSSDKLIEVMNNKKNLYFKKLLK
jgi:radical SAM superfamily enzyme YgiQ (UPF0313 family)